MSDTNQKVLKPYHLIVKNNGRLENKAVLFGSELYLKVINFGSVVPIVIKSADGSIEYLDLLKQSQENNDLKFEAKGIRIITDSWRNMPKSIYYKNSETDFLKTISLVDSETWGKNSVLNMAVNDIELPELLISGRTKFVLQLEPLSELEILIY